MPKGKIPGRDEPDPENLRLRPFQGGTDGLPDGTAPPVTYGDVAYEDGHGPAAGVTARGGGAGAGLSGLPAADSGTAPALFNEPLRKPKE